MTKKEWLQERVWVDEYGRPYNLSDIPMTVMSRKESFEKRRYGKKMINQLWKEDLEDVKMVKERSYG